MSKSRCLAVALLCSLVAIPTIPTISSAQAADSTKEHAEDFVHDVLQALIGPNWNLFAHGGFATGHRFVLQRAANTLDGQRALRSSTGFNVGAGAGVDILLRMGLRVNYTFSSSDLNFKTDDGTGSDALNIDNVGRVKTHTAALEIMRYMLPSRATINPYGTLGIQGTWWVLDETSPLVTSGGASTPFSLGPLFSFGVQFKATDHWGGRLEASLSSGHNPFTGNQSFRALSGQTIDEPSGVNRTEYRLAGVYHFGKPRTATGMLPVAHK
jgi:opacity protein-like surface antigen